MILWRFTRIYPQIYEENFSPTICTPINIYCIKVLYIYTTLVIHHQWYEPTKFHQNIYYLSIRCLCCLRFTKGGVSWEYARSSNILVNVGCKKSDVSSMDANITMECLSAHIIVSSNVSLKLES